MKKIFIIIDNGHGKETAGKRSPDGKFLEWKWTRDFAQLLSQRLDKLGIAHHILVPEDNDIGLQSRCVRVNTIKKNMQNYGYDAILISLHNNAADSDGKWHNATGFTSWICPVASQKSKQLAMIFGKNALQMKLSGNRYYPPENFFTANYKILRDTNCPAILNENMFMDNESDVKFLMSEEGKEKLLSLYENSILEYMRENKYES